MSKFGDWWVGFRNAVEAPFESLFGQAEQAGTVFVEDLGTEIEKAGPALLASVASSAISAGTVDGKLDISAAVTAAITTAKAQGLAAAEHVVAGAVAAAAATLTANPVAAADADVGTHPIGVATPAVEPVTPAATADGA